MRKCKDYNFIRRLVLARIKAMRELRAPLELVKLEQMKLAQLRAYRRVTHRSTMTMH